MPNGILPLYKPRGLTSFDCVAKIRRLYQTRKVGHSGTLDPGVDGVLPQFRRRDARIDGL